MTLAAYAPNGKRITHEYYLIPYMASVEWDKPDDLFGVEPEDIFENEIVPEMHYPGRECTPEHHTEYEHDLAGNKRLRELRWMDEDGGLWASEDLTFKEEQ